VELLKEMFNILQNKDVAELLGFVQNIIKTYFDKYTGGMGVADYSTFLKFCRDFEVFPELCSKMILHSTFYALAFVNSRIIGEPEIDPNNQSENITFTSKCKLERKTNTGIKVREYLELPLFVEALALCAFQSKNLENETDNIAKIIRMMQKITQSAGVTKVKKMIGNTRIAAGDIDPLMELKLKYPTYFEKKYLPLHTEDAVAEAFGELEIQEAENEEEKSDL